MVFYLIYGTDSVGKTVQLKNICENHAESALYISLEPKDRKLLKDAPFAVEEPLVIDDTNNVVPVDSFNNLGKLIEKVMKENKHDLVVIDGISDIPKWAEKVVIKKIQQMPGKAGTKVIGKENLTAWAARNNLAYLPLERMALWAVKYDRKVFATTLMTDDYVGEKKVGRTIDAKDRVRKLSDVRIQLTNDGRGRLAKFEKVPGWAEEGPADVAVTKTGLAVELLKRGLL